MPYQIETYDAGMLISRTLVEGTEREAIERAEALVTPPNVTFVRIIEVESEANRNGPEIWSVRRDA